MQPASKLSRQSLDFDTMGGRISRAREDMHITSSQLARRLGVKSNTVRDWENDRAEPRANRVVMLAGVLGVSPTWLLTGFGDAPAATNVTMQLSGLIDQLSSLRDTHAKMGRTIKILELEAERLSGALGPQ
ncbi:MAG: helix-turn-helix domain-containing protein [Alphaproteobacteria bacterium]|nr:helix-turn-helix domain-containing protein [Alphaproteobacteria bacterium]